jgi:hypothetical protein
VSFLFLLFLAELESRFFSCLGWGRWRGEGRGRSAECEAEERLLLLTPSRVDEGLPPEQSLCEALPRRIALKVDFARKRLERAARATVFLGRLLKARRTTSAAA